MKRLLLKTVSVVITVFIVGTLIAGCGGKAGNENVSKPTTGTSAQDEGKSQEKIVITWMKSGSPSGIEARDLLFNTFPELGDKYTLEPVIAGKQNSDVAQKMRLSLAANAEISDIVTINNSMLAEFVMSGAIEDVTDSYEAYKDELIPAAFDCVTINGRAYAYITQIKNKLWFYRKDMFDEAGIDPDKIKTTDDFIEAGKKLQAKFPNSYIWNIGSTIDHYNLGMVLSGNGARLINENNEYIVSQDPGVRKAFEDFKKIVESGIVAPINDFTPDWERAFADGTLASTLSVIWFRDASYLPKWAPDQAGKWAVTQWPEIAGAVGGSQDGAGLNVIPVKAKNKEGAKLIMEKLTLSKEGNIAHYLAVPTSFPINKEAIKDPRVQQADPYFGPSLIPAIEKSLEIFKVMPFTPASDREFQILNNALSKYLTTDISLDDVLKEAENDLKTQIGNPFELFN